MTHKVLVDSDTIACLTNTIAARDGELTEHRQQLGVAHTEIQHLREENARLRGESSQPEPHSAGIEEHASRVVGNMGESVNDEARGFQMSESNNTSSLKRGRDISTNAHERPTKHSKGA